MRPRRSIVTMCATFVVVAATLSPPATRAETVTAVDEPVVTPAAASPATGAAFAPSPSGGATYRIPIVVPPGTAGVEPELALVYNSHAPNGLLGPGWALEGLTAITRCAATHAQDGRSGGIAFDANDRFCLSGQRLMAVAGEYGAPGTEYRTEVDSMVRVVSYGTAGTGPAWFRVWTKAGRIMDFGGTRDSRLLAQGTASALVWALSRIADTSGNHVTVTYQQDTATGESRPFRIDYTGNDTTGFAPTRSVVFSYDARPDSDVRRLYVGGSRVTVPVVLSRVTTYVGPTVARVHRLEYEAAGMPARARLVRVTECAGDGACLPPTDITWQAPGEASLTTTWSESAPQNVETLTGDFDGDGRADVIQVWTTTNRAQVLLSRGDGTFGAAWTSPSGAGTSGFFWLAAPLGTLVGDFNGDGLSDVLQVRNDTHVAQTLLAVGDGSFRTAWTSPGGSGSDGWVMRAGVTRTMIGDVDGDGLADIVQIRTDAPEGHVLRSRGDGTFGTAWTFPAGLLIRGALAHSFLRDVNGDGRADIVQVRTDQHSGQVLLGAGDGSFALAWTSASSGGGWLVRGGVSQTLVEDLNGDGVADILQIRSDTHWAQVLLSRGDGSFATAWTSASTAAEPGFLYRAAVARTFIGDFNGDRRIDLIQIQSGSHDARILLGAGDGSFIAAWQSSPSGDGWVIRADVARTVIDDIDGDGLADVVQHRGDNGMMQVLLARGMPPDLVTSIRSPLGGVVSITYRPATDPSVHERDSGSLYPTVDRPVAVPIVAASSTSDGQGTTATVTYRYGGMKHDLRGRGPLGFAWRRVVDDAGVQTTTWVHQTFPLLGLVMSSVVADGAGLVLRKTDHLWSPVATSAATAFARHDQTDTWECDGRPACRQISASFEYDALGNVTRTVSFGDIAAGDEVRDEYTEWAIDPTRWLHRPTRMVVYGPGGQLLRERWISYDGMPWGSLGPRGLPTREESRLAGGLGTAGNPVVQRGYNAYGNATSVTDARGCTTTTAFETTHRAYPATVTTCLGHRTTFAHDARWGARTSETDPNGQTTTFEYDGFGRLTRVTGPLDRASAYGTAAREYLDFGNPTLQRIVTYRTTAHGSANVVWSEESLDGLGRVYRSRSGAPGSTIVVRTVFDARGLVAKTSVPRLATEPAAWIEFTYDALRRRTRSTKPDGTSTTTEYAPGQVTTTDERGKVTRRRLDGFGRVTRVEELNGATTWITRYSYDATGSLRSVTNHLGHVTAIAYDRLGRKTRLSAPDTGTWTYAHDAGGLLIRQTDAERRTIAFDYDAQGRIRFKRYPDGRQVEWIYDDPTVPYGRGRLARVADPAASTTFRYDAVGRVIATDRVLDGTRYTLGRTYDALGRVTSETFPDGDVVTYGFNAAGWLETVGNAASTAAYVRGIAYNARGQRTQVSYANDVTSTFTYFDAAGDSMSLRLKRVVTRGPAGVLQDLAYVHDAAGNITRITDTVGTASRTFAYDARRRLTSAAGPFGPAQAPVTQSYSYDAIGNIRTKHGVTYAYGDPRHVSAVTGRSDGATYTYDANGNTVTGAGRAMTWDADNRLAAITIQAGASAEFAYDYAGHRVRKTVNGTKVTRYPFPGYEVDPAGAVTKRFAGVAIRANVGTLFYHDDHLGGVHVITDANGSRVQLVEYDPWGAVSRSEGKADPTRRFTGQTLDPESGLMYYGGRYYDPVLGRFVSPDPFVHEPADPQALNRYSYVVNNPVNAIDPSGYSFWDDLGDFFEDLGESLWRNAPAIVVGVAVGAVAVATGGFGLGLVGPTLAIFAGAAGGAASGVVTAGMYGGDLATSILMGAAFGAVGGAIAPGLGAALGGGWRGAVGTGLILGGAFGGVNAAMNGGDVLTGIAAGALSGALVSAATYGGYQAWKHATADGPQPAPVLGPEDIGDGLEIVRIRTFARRVSFFPLAWHKGYEVVRADGSIEYYEMGSDGRGIRIYGNDVARLLPESRATLFEPTTKWSAASYTFQTALTAQQDIYALTHIGRSYNAFHQNSNWYVNFVLRGAGVDPRVRGIWAPSFGQ